MSFRLFLFLLALGLTPPAAVLAGDHDVFANPPTAQVLILGEIHDNPLHHANQARAVAAAAPAALVFEMLTPAQAGRVLAHTRNDPEQLQELLEWEKRGWPDFEMYFPIFEAAPAARIFGGARPRDDARTAITKGAASAFGPGAWRYGLAESLPEDEQTTREAAQQEAHCNALPPEMLPGMVEAQRLRDAAMAEAVLRALRETGGPVALITGSGHARLDWGVPAAIARAAPDVTIYSIGQVEGDAFGEGLFNHLVVTEPTERPDPCAAFRKDDG